MTGPVNTKVYREVAGGNFSVYFFCFYFNILRQFYRSAFLYLPIQYMDL